MDSSILSYPEHFQPDPEVWGTKKPEYKGKYYICPWNHETDCYARDGKKHTHKILSAYDIRSPRYIHHGLAVWLQTWGIWQYGVSDKHITSTPFPENIS